MDELLGAILGAILEILGEFLIELLMGLIADLVSRLVRRFFINAHRMGPVLSAVTFALAGCAAGLLSIAIAPHPIFATHRFHGASLLISPIAAGLGMSFFGWIVSARGGRRARIESFRYGFVFALAMAIVRLVLISRP